MYMTDLNIVILAAGQGTRMYSNTPKVLHKIAGKSLLERIISVAKTLNPHKIIIIYGHSGELVKDTMEQQFPNDQFTWVYQDQQLGTGHALKCALPYLSNSGKTLVLCGDVPLINHTTLVTMLNKYQNNIIMLTDYEKTELLGADAGQLIYTVGNVRLDQKIQGAPGKNFNFGYDDEQGDYTVVLGDHIGFRYLVLDFLGKGSFGQALKCEDLANERELVCLKLIRNKSKFRHQAQVELQIVQHLKEQDPQD